MTTTFTVLLGLFAANLVGWQGEPASLQQGDLSAEQIRERLQSIARDLQLDGSDWDKGLLMTYDGQRRCWAFWNGKYVVTLDSRRGSVIRVSIGDGSHSVKPDSHRTGHRYFGSDEDAKMELQSIANKLGVWPGAVMRYSFHPDDPNKSNWGYYLASFKPNFGPYAFLTVGPRLAIVLDSETGRIVEVTQERDFLVVPTEIRISETQAKDLAWQIYQNYCSEKEVPMRGTRETATAKLGYGVQNGFNGTRRGWDLAPFEARLVYRIAFCEPIPPGVYDHIDLRADTGELWAGAVIGHIKGPKPPSPGSRTIEVTRGEGAASKRG